MFVIDSLYTKYVKHGNKTLYMCFIDSKKAYDKVWRYSLLLKLLESGVSGTLYSIIEDMYKYNISCVGDRDKIWGKFSSNDGVRQGDVLSPILFNMYINDISKYIEEGDVLILNGLSVNCLMYADDLVISTR